MGIFEVMIYISCYPGQRYGSWHEIAKDTEIGPRCYKKDECEQSRHLNEIVWRRYLPFQVIVINIYHNN